MFFVINRMKIVEVGDEVEADDTVCEIETDKIGLEVRAPQSGKIVERLFEVKIKPIGHNDTHIYI